MTVSNGTTAAPPLYRAFAYAITGVWLIAITMFATASYDAFTSGFGGHWFYAGVAATLAAYYAERVFRVVAQRADQLRQLQAAEQLMRRYVEEQQQKMAMGLAEDQLADNSELPVN